MYRWADLYSSKKSIRNSKKKSEKPTLPKVYSSIFGNFFVEMCHKILVILFWGEQSHDLRVYVSMITKNGSQIDSERKKREIQLRTNQIASCK